jgi:spore maturation protein CgeB
VRLVWGNEYNLALCGAKVALVFLSKLNRDTYTRRTFEIPGSGTAMLSEYTDDLAELFKEGSEIEFFRNPEQMLQKISSYLGDEKRRHSIAKSGHDRVLADGHDVVSRMKQVVHLVLAVREQRV